MATKSIIVGIILIALFVFLSLYSESPVEEAVGGVVDVPVKITEPDVPEIEPEPRNIPVIGI